jgi:hypothetical protein
MATNGAADEVRVGVYADRVSELSIKETGWTVDFYIWFLWKNKELNPGENFQVVEGEIETREKDAEATLPDGTFYALYRVKARMTKFFTLTRFPADDHLLTIRIEDRALPIERLYYVGDKENSAISSRVKLPGYEGYQTSVVVQPHSYKTTRGDPRLKSGQTTFSQFIFGVWMKREGLGFYLKLFCSRDCTRRWASRFWRCSSSPPTLTRGLDWGWARFSPPWPMLTSLRRNCRTAG